MITPDELAAMRATSAAALPDTCVISSPVSTGTLNDVTGEWTPGAATVIYTGACRLRPPDTSEIRVLAGEEQLSRQRFILTIASSGPAPAVDDIAIVTSTSDVDMHERPFRVIGYASSSWLIDRRMIVEAVE